MAARKKARLGDFVETQKGYAFKSGWYCDTGRPIVKVSNFTDDSVDSSAFVCIPESTATDYLKYALHTGDVVVQTVGSWPTNPASVVGKCVRIPGEVAGALLNQNAVKLTPSESLDRAFLFYLLRNDDFKTYIIGTAQGAASQAAITLEAIRGYEFELPPLPVQRRIAGILSTYDELIENSQRRIKILESMARALYHEWFVNFRFPGHESVPRLPSPFGEIPQGWEVKSVGEVADTFRGRSYRSVDLADEGGLPFLNLKCLDRDGGFRRSGLKRYTGEYKEIHVAKRGDIVMAVTDMTQERRIVARAALVPTLDNEFGIFSMDLVRIEPKAGLPKAFLYSFLRYSSFADEVKQHANGANVLHLSPDRITDFRFPSPPTDLMIRFADFATPVLEEIDTLENKVENLRRTRDLLLPRLLTGQIDVSRDLPEEVITHLEAAPTKMAVPTPPGKSEIAHDVEKTLETKSPKASTPRDEISREDVLFSMRKLFSDGTIRDRETALRDLAYLLGYQRLGARIRDELAAAMMTAVRRGILKNDGGEYTLGFKSVEECTRDSLKGDFLSAMGRAWITRSDAVQSFARFLGFGRVGHVIDDTALTLINGLIREGSIETDGPELIRRR